MEIEIITFLAVSCLLIGSQTACAVTDAKMHTFDSIPCSNQSVEDVLKSSSVKEETTHSILGCATSCVSNGNNCSAAVYRQITKTCRHMYKGDGNTAHPTPPYADENGCFVLRKHDKSACQTGSTSPGTVYSKMYLGECWEEARPAFCDSSSWREVRLSDHSTLNASSVHLKVVVDRGPSHTHISDVDSVYFGGNNDRFQFHDFLTVNATAESFESPLKREFNSYTEWSGALVTKQFSMRRIFRTNTAIPNFNYSLLMRDIVDDNRLVFQNGVQGNLTSLIGELCAGHRTILRNPSRTEFNENTDDVVIQRTRTTVSALSINSPYYISTKNWIGKYEYVGQWYITTEAFRTYTTNVDKSRVEIDRCWLKIPPLGRNDRMLRLLQEIVLSLGKEVRLILAASIATDITMVTVTDSDVIVTLAEYFTPSNAASNLRSSSRIRYSMVSLSNTLVECDMKFEGDNVYHINNGSSPSGLEWVVSYRTWKMTFAITSTGSIINFNGSHADVYSAAVSGKGIRVCIEFAGCKSVCFTGTTLDLDNDSKHVMLQSHPTLNVGLNPDRTFSGLVDSQCKRTTYLVSTKGWVKSATYVIHVRDPPDAIAHVSCLKTTWFSQD